jgi:RNA-directed DNA polymerase
MSDLIKTQRSLATQAMHQPAHRFDHLYRLLGQRAGIATALRGVLANTGARPPGLAGITQSPLSSEEATSTLIQAIGQALRERSFRPSPVRRISIPKSHGQQRPLGLSTLKDRVVQMVLKMGLEPIWASDLLNGSNGFRPGRRTLDWIALLDSSINARHKSCWVLEGDIHAACDRMHHTTLHHRLAQRIADQRLRAGIDHCLTAGMMQGERFSRTEIGTPQGAMSTLPTKLPTSW